MKKNNKGFTLAELLIVVAVIAVLVAVAIPTFTNQLEKSRQAVDISNLREAYAAARLAEQAQMIGEAKMGTESVDSVYNANGSGTNYTIKTGYDPKTGDLTLSTVTGDKQIKAKSNKVVADTDKLSARIHYYTSDTEGTLAPSTDKYIVVTFKSTNSGASYVLESVTFAENADIN